MAGDTPDQRYAQIVRTFLQRPGITQQGRGFGAAALKVRGKMFATLTPAGTFVVKLPRHRVDALAADGQGRPFEPGPGRVMTQWLELHAASGQDWMPLAEEALAYVGGTPR